MSERIVLRTGEALVEADQAWSAAEPEVMIGALDGPVGHAMAQQLLGQVKGHTRVFALLNSDEATTKALTKAMQQEPSIDWLLEHQQDVEHYFHQLALDGLRAPQE